MHLNGQNLLQILRDWVIGINLFHQYFNFGIHHRYFFLELIKPFQIIQGLVKLFDFFSVINIQLMYRLIHFPFNLSFRHVQKLHVLVNLFVYQLNSFIEVSNCFFVLFIKDLDEIVTATSVFFKSSINIVEFLILIKNLTLHQPKLFAIMGNHRFKLSEVLTIFIFLIFVLLLKSLETLFYICFILLEVIYFQQFLGDAGIIMFQFSDVEQEVSHAGPLFFKINRNSVSLFDEWLNHALYLISNHSDFDPIKRMAFPPITHLL